MQYLFPLLETTEVALTDTIPSVMRIIEEQNSTTMSCKDLAVALFGTITKELTLHLKCKLFDTNFLFI